MNEFDVAADAIVMQVGSDAMRFDPLAYFKTTSVDQRRFLAELGNGEIYCHAGNEWGKTTIGGYAGVALARGKKELDGIPLPALPVPNVGVVCSLDFKQQRLSVQPKYLAAIGDWPHKIEWNGETVVSIRVKPDSISSMDPEDWSLIMFISAENRRSGTGFRGHWAHGDEPPPEWLWRELRKMGEAGSLFINFITATALKRSQWYWLRKDYPIECEGRRHNGFLRLRAPAFDPDDATVGNQALTAYDKRRLLAAYATDPLRVARITGKEIDTSGSSPFRMVYDVLERWAEQAADGWPKLFEVSREIITSTGKELMTEMVDLEVWENVDPGCVYRVIVDPSLGIDDGEHDPALVEVFNMTKKSQAVRYNGYIGEYGAGVLAGRLSALWNDGLVDIAKTGGYGSACLSGLRVVGCRRVVSQKVKSKKGLLERDDVGYNESKETRADYSAYLTEALKASKMGHPYMTIRSRADIHELMDLVFDKAGKIVTQNGMHDEAFAVIGRFASLVSPEKRVQSISKASQKVPEGPIDKLRKLQGLPPRRYDNNGNLVNRAKPLTRRGKPWSNGRVGGQAFSRRRDG